MSSAHVMRSASLAASMSAATDLAPISDADLARRLRKQRWLLCSDPFPHVRADNVFDDATYAELAAAFDAVLSERGLPAWPQARFSRNMIGYDAFGADFDSHVGWPFTLFVSQPWHDLFARLFGVTGVGCMSGALHHHLIDSQSGHVHNDLNPGWFAELGNAGRIELPRSELCHYRNGSLQPGVTIEPHETIRAVAILYYLNNDNWREGDGGETGLYRPSTENADHAAVFVPPRNNSLVAFECTPTSFHTFRRNVRQPRNSVIVWLHRSKADAVARWGDDAIVRWP